LGLLSTHCALLGAGAACGVDKLERTLRLAKSVARCADVDVHFEHADLNEQGCLEKLGVFRPDIVFALSVVHRLTDNKAVSKLLANARIVYYEGGGRTQDEISWLRCLGFSNVTVLGYTDHLRPLILASH
jgi:hypothetical protein